MTLRMLWKLASSLRQAPARFVPFSETASLQARSDSNGTCRVMTTPIMFAVPRTTDRTPWLASGPAPLDTGVRIPPCRSDRNPFITRCRTVRMHMFERERVP